MYGHTDRQKKRGNKIDIQTEWHIDLNLGRQTGVQKIYTYILYRQGCKQMDNYNYLVSMYFVCSTANYNVLNLYLRFQKTWIVK